MPGLPPHLVQEFNFGTALLDIRQVLNPFILRSTGFLTHFNPLTLKSSTCNCRLDLTITLELIMTLQNILNKTVGIVTKNIFPSNIFLSML